MTEGARGPNQLKAGAALSYLVIGLQFVVAMLYTPIMLRLLGQAEYGLYSLVGSIVSCLALLSFGFGGAYMRFYSRFRVVEDWDGVRRLNGLFLVVFTGIGLIAAAGGTLLSLNVDAVLGIQFSGEQLDTARIFFATLFASLLASQTPSIGATMRRTTTSRPVPLPPWDEALRCSVDLRAHMKVAKVSALVSP
ncbi:MAG: hypothetical protein EOL89_05675 [Actinobacteria bacterium]|nr:hypothetical protein [Actinomycetota bacterium]